MAAHLRFAKLILNKPQDLSSNALWTDKTRVEMFDGDQAKNVSTNTSYQLSCEVTEG